MSVRHLNISLLCFQDGTTSFIVPVESETNKYIISLDRSLCEFEWDGFSTDAFKLNKIISVEEDCHTSQFNDGKCDPQGRLWTGKFIVSFDGNSREVETSSLFR